MKLVSFQKTWNSMKIYLSKIIAWRHDQWRQRIKIWCLEEWFADGLGDTLNNISLDVHREQCRSDWHMTLTSLLNDTISDSVYVMANNRMYNELKTMWKEAAVA
jgi:hypothetical protein